MEPSLLLLLLKMAACCCTGPSNRRARLKLPPGVVDGSYAEVQLLTYLLKEQQGASSEENKRQEAHPNDLIARHIYRPTSDVA